MENTSFTETLPLVEPSSCEEEEIQPLALPFEFEDDLFKDYGNTSNYLYQKRPPVPVGPTEPLDKAFLKEMVRDLTAVMSSEWVQEGELSSESLQIIAPSLTIHCFIQGTLGEVLYNPMVGANIMSASYVLTHLENALVPTEKTLRIAPGSILEGVGIVHNVRTS